MNRILVRLSLILLTLLCSKAFAFELWPELQFFDTREADEIERPSRFDGPFYSDMRSFQRRLENEAAWWSEDNVYYGSVGSLDAFRFMTEERLRVRHKFSERTRVGVLFVNQRDFYFSSRNLLLELSRRVGERMTFSLYGNFRSEKNDLDVGGTLAYRLSDESTITAGYFLPDFSYNKRNRESGKFDVAPVTYFVSHKMQTVSSRTETFYRYEPALNWRLIPEDQRYFFSKQILGFRHFRRSQDGSINTFQADIEDKFELKSLLSDFSDNEYWRMQRAKLEYARLPGGGSNWVPYRFGLRAISTRWETNDRSKVEQHTALPFFEYRYKVGPKRRNDTLGVEYSAALHWDKDLDNAAFRSDHDQTIDHRANISYDFIYPQSGGRISLMVTVDLDRFGTGNTWNGGAGQAQFSF